MDGKQHFNNHNWSWPPAGFSIQNPTPTDPNCTKADESEELLRSKGYANARHRSDVTLSDQGGDWGPCKREVRRDWTEWAVFFSSITVSFLLLLFGNHWSLRQDNGDHWSLRQDNGDHWSLRQDNGDHWSLRQDNGDQFNAAYAHRDPTDF